MRALLVQIYTLVSQRTQLAWISNWLFEIHIKMLSVDPHYLSANLKSSPVVSGSRCVRYEDITSGIGGRMI